MTGEGRGGKRESKELPVKRKKSFSFLLLLLPVQFPTQSIFLPLIANEKD
jgi:hypothetical protein